MTVSIKKKNLVFMVKLKLKVKKKIERKKKKVEEIN